MSPTRLGSFAALTLLFACGGGDASDDGSVPSDGSMSTADANVDAHVASDADTDEDATTPSCGEGGAITRAFTVRTMRVAGTTIGANIDGLDNSQTPNSVAGCRTADNALGTENRAAALNGASFGIPSDVGQQGITAGTITLTFTLSAWNGTRDDACVVLTASGTGTVGSLSVTTTLTDGLIDARLPADSGWNITGALDGVNLTIPLRGLHAHLLLDGSLTELVLPVTPTALNASFLAGYIIYADAMGSLTGSDFRPRMLSFMDAIGQSGNKTIVDDLGMSLRDLHAIGGLRPCMSVAGGDPNAVDVDALSAALLISTNAP
jgi:hypothetical protein